MGIDIDAEAFYGIVFSYNQLKHLKTLKEWKELAEQIGTDNLYNLWTEWGFYCCSPYFDAPEEEVNYIIGLNITHYSMTEIKELDEEQIKNEIKEDCIDLKLKYKDPKFIVLPHIW